ncbi:MAG: hypothetical protein ACYTF6_09850 [Planctomycetota bacterium]
MREDYTFEAEVTVAETGESHKFDSTERQFWYKPLPRQGQQPQGERFRPMQGGRLASTQLPAVVIFADQVPLGEEVAARVSGFDQYQRQHAARVKELSSSFVSWRNAEPLFELPLLPPAPRLYLKPITYEVHTVKDGPFVVHYRLVVEDLTGYKPRVAVNERRRPIGESLPAEAPPEPFRWDIAPGSVRISPRDLGVRVRVESPIGLSAWAKYNFREMDRVGMWGYELDGPQPVSYSGLPGGRTPIVFYGGIYAHIEEVPLVTRFPARPGYVPQGALELVVGDRRYPAGMECELASEPVCMHMRDERGEQTVFYAWKMDVYSKVFVLVDHEARLSDRACERLIFPATLGQLVGASATDDSSASALADVGPFGIGGQTVTFVSGSLRSVADFNVWAVKNALEPRES